MNTQETAISLTQETLSVSIDLNKVYSQSNAVGPLFHTHFVDMGKGLSGIADLIGDILTQAGAVYPEGVELTELRPVAVAGSLYTEEIIQEVQARFAKGTKRYPDQTIRSYLSLADFNRGRFGKIQLSKAEDSPRPCPKPRCKWYLIVKQDTKSE